MTTTTDAPSAEESTERQNVRDAYESVEEALGSLGIRDEQYETLHKEYFALKARLRALDPEFQAMDLSGTRLNVPHASSVFDPPTVEDEHGEWEAPTKSTDQIRVLDSVTVADPKNPHVTHGVTVDHAIFPSGNVRVEVNALPLDEVGKEQGSHIQ